MLGRGRGLGRRQDALRRQLLELGRGLLMPALTRDLPAEQSMREQAFGELRRWRHRYPAAFEKWGVNRTSMPATVHRGFDEYQWPEIFGGLNPTAPASAGKLGCRRNAGRRRGPGPAAAGRRDRRSGVGHGRTNCRPTSRRLLSEKFRPRS